MAITPRTILTSAAPATVAMASLYIFTFLGIAAYKSVLDTPRHHATSPTISYYSGAQMHAEYPNVCETLVETFGAEKLNWSESAWVMYAHCYEQQARYRQSLSIVYHGLQFYPASESLHILTGYYLIKLGDHTRAIAHMKNAKQRIPSHMQSGILDNNLAWAGLMAPRSISLEESKTLYQRALQLNPNQCEVLHTGLWVEYAQLKRASNPLERQSAASAFQQLFEKYSPCLSESRLDSNDRNVLIELTGLIVILDDVMQMASLPEMNYESESFDVSGQALTRPMTKLLARQGSDLNPEMLCREASPLAETHHICVQYVQGFVQYIRTEKLRDSAPRNCSMQRR